MLNETKKVKTRISPFSRLHPITKATIIITLISTIVCSFSFNELFGFFFNIAVLSLLLAVNRKLCAHILFLLISASFFLSLLYIIDIRHQQLNINNLSTVIKFLWRYLLIINTFLSSAFLMSREEAFFLLSKFLPEKMCITLVNVVYLFQMSKRKFEDYLNFLKLRFDKRPSLKERIKLLPLLVQNLAISLLNDLQLYEVSFRNKLLGNKCNKKKTRLFQFSSPTTTDYFLITLCILLNISILFYLIGR